MQSRAPVPPEVEKTESISTSSLIDVDGPSVQSVHSDFSSQDVKTATQAERLEREAEEILAREQAASSGKKGKKSQASSLRKNAQNPVYLVNAVIVTALGAVLGYGGYRKYIEGKLSWKVASVWAGTLGLFGGLDYFVSKWVFFLSEIMMELGVWYWLLYSSSRWFIQNKYPLKD